MKDSSCCQVSQVSTCNSSRLRSDITEGLLESQQNIKDTAEPEKDHNRTSILHLHVTGMDCGGCAACISAALAKIPLGITSHVITIADSKLQVFFDNTVVTSEEIQACIERSGYSCEVASDAVLETLSALAKQADCDNARERFLLSCFLSVILYILSWIAGTYDTLLSRSILPGFQLMDLISLFLLIPLLRNMDTIYASANTAARSGRMNPNTLVVCAITISLLYSILALAVSMYNCAPDGTETFFETAGELSTLTLLGRWIETSAGTMTTSPLSSLLKLVPDNANRLEFGRETLVATSHLKIHDVLVVYAQERFPADCTILTGTALVDDSAIHGDLMPVLKQEGEEVFAGTTNLSIAVHCTVLRTGMKTHLGQTTALLLNAQTNKARIELLAERVAGHLVPVLLGLSACTFLFWLVWNPLHYISHLAQPELGRVMMSLKLGISVLVVACPCALTIATPTAVMVGTAAAAKMGVLVKGASVLECIDSVSDIVFDKTGTLTKGRLDVCHVQFASSLTEQQKSELWSMMYLAESTLESAHPVCQAIKSFYREQIMLTDTRLLHIRDVIDVSGSGLTCLVNDADFFPDSSRLVMGNRALCDNENILLPTSSQIKCATDTFRHSIDKVYGQTRMHVALNGLLVCTLSFHDDIKEDARETIDLLRCKGKTVWMLTGDEGRVAHKVAADVGIPSRNVLSECTIAQKADFIRSLQAQHKVVAMVGDGVNDVLALTLADVGISLAGSSAVARESADVILMKNNKLEGILTSILLAQDVCLKVKYNLFWAFGWNVLAVPCAMGMFLPWNIYIPPAIAALVMSLSCLCIILSSLTLRSWNRRYVDREQFEIPSENHNARYQSSLRKLFRDALVKETLATNKHEV